MKQTEQAQEQRQVCIEHEFCASDPMLPGEKCAQKIRRKESLKKQKAGGLPGKN